MANVAKRAISQVGKINKWRHKMSSAHVCATNFLINSNPFGPKVGEFYAAEAPFRGGKKKTRKNSNSSCRTNERSVSLVGIFFNYLLIKINSQEKWILFFFFYFFSFIFLLSSSYYRIFFGRPGTPLHPFNLRCFGKFYLI